MTMTTTSTSPLLHGLVRHIRVVVVRNRKPRHLFVVLYEVRLAPVSPHVHHLDGVLDAGRRLGLIVEVDQEGRELLAGWAPAATERSGGGGSFVTLDDCDGRDERSDKALRI